MVFSDLTDTTNLNKPLLSAYIVTRDTIQRCVFPSEDYDDQYIQVLLRASETKVIVIRDFDEPLGEVYTRVCLNELKEKRLSPARPLSSSNSSKRNTTADKSHIIESLQSQLIDSISHETPLDCLKSRGSAPIDHNVSRPSASYSTSEMLTNQQMF